MMPSKTFNNIQLARHAKHFKAIMDILNLLRFLSLSQSFLPNGLPIDKDKQLCGRNVQFKVQAPAKVAIKMSINEFLELHYYLQKRKQYDFITF